jgi:dihydroflavonol-4-reductase
MEEALHAGVERIVYTSSVATIELRAGAPADESRPLGENRSRIHREQAGGGQPAA